MPFSLRVLLVDDQPSDLILLGDLLGDFGADMKVTTAMSGEEALAYLDATSTLPHMMLLDWHLTGMSGLDVLRGVKTAPRFQGLAVVIRSGSEDPEDRRAALEAGADDFLGKPLGIDMLEAQLRDVVQRWCHGSGQV